MSVQITINRRDRNPFRVDMRKVGEVAVRAIRERTARGVNSQDQPAKALTPAYAKAKLRAGAQPIRDLRLTGGTIAALAVTEVSAGRVVIGFNDASAELRAKRDEAVEPMLKLSPRDKQIVMRAMQQNVG